MVSDRAALLRLLCRVRRRLRLLATLQGAVRGAALALATVAAVQILRRAGAWPELDGAWTAGVALVTAFSALGAARRIPLARSARAVDAAVRAADRNGDRVRCALALLESAPGPFVDAAVRDALRTAGPMRPGAAAPFRRPRGLPALAAAAAAAIVATLWPAPRAPEAAGRSSAGAPRAAPRADGLFARDRAATAEAARIANARADERLAELAAGMDGLLAAIERGAVPRGEALGRLAALERAAAAAARESRRLAEAMRAAGESLSREEDAPLRPLGDALEDLDGARAQQALRELARAAAERGGEKLSEALQRALASTLAAEQQAPERSSSERPRRLSRADDSRQGGESAPGERGSPDRKLERLERNLSEAADECARDPEACRRALEQAGADMPDLARSAQQAGARRSLERAVAQARERLRRHGAGPAPQAGAERAFERSARGEAPSEMGEGPALERAGGEGRENGAGGEESGGIAAQDEGATGEGHPGQAMGERTAATETSSALVAGGSAGAGAGPGGDPLGRRERGGDGARGEKRHAPVRSGAGPSRAEVIEAGAQGGFVRDGYERVFEDYTAAVEEALDTTAVPPARRYLVRRYFELIRPRTKESP